VTQGALIAWRDAAGYIDDNSALFRPIRNNRIGLLEKALTPDPIYKLVRRYSADLGFDICAYALRSSPAANGLTVESTRPMSATAAFSPRIKFQHRRSLLVSGMNRWGAGHSDRLLSGPSTPDERTRRKRGWFGACA
jgi:hypothetical protein